jgi:hypothetical protein
LNECVCRHGSNRVTKAAARLDEMDAALF